MLSIIRKLSLVALFAVFSVASSYAQTVVNPPRAWPGQSGNGVGYANSPGWPGSFNGTACPASPSSGTSWANPVVISNCTYSSSAVRNATCSYCIFKYVDFVNTTVGATDHTVGVQADHIMFIGDRFQSNAPQTSNVASGHDDIWFLYDSFVPLASFYTSPPGFTQWPGAGAGANSTTMTSGVNSVPQADAYQFAIAIYSGGSIVVDHCDMWGYGNAIAIQDSFNSQATITSNWIHDTAYPGSGAGQYHNDGIGYLNTNAAPNNVTIIGNAVGMLGNTNALAMQQATSGYNAIIINENYWSGDGATIAWFQPGAVHGTNSTLYGNTFATDVAAGGPLYNPGATISASNVWACNSISVLPGTTWIGFTDGQFFINNTAENSNTDQGSNTHCGITTPAASDFGFQSVGSSSPTQTIKLYNTNTATLSISSVALATGTQFAIVSNGCGSTLASGANCAITVKFAPTAQGPQADTLQITDNTAGVSSPQPVPLLGIGMSSSAVLLSPSTQNFGSLNVGSSSSPITFTLTNNNSTTATSISPTKTGGNTGDFTIVNSGAGSCAAASGSLAQGASCTFTVTFSPAAAGSRATTLSVSYSGGDSASPQTSALSGTGVAPTSPAPAAGMFATLNVEPIPAQTSAPTPTLTKSAPANTYLSSKGFSQDGVTFTTSLNVSLTGTNLNVGAATCTFNGTTIPCSCSSSTLCTAMVASSLIPVPTKTTSYSLGLSLAAPAPTPVPVLQ